MNNLPKSKIPFKTILISLVLLACIGYLVYEKLNLESNLKSSTQITLGLKNELEDLKKENLKFQDSDLKKISEIENLSKELNNLKVDKSMSVSQQEQLKKLVDDAEKTLNAQNRKISEMEAKLKDAEDKIAKQEKESANLEKQTQTAKTKPGMTPEYVKMVENEWLEAVAKTESLRKDLNHTLREISSRNQERTKLRNETATMHYNLAVILTQQENYSAAITEYQKVLETRPDDADAHYNLAILYDDHLKNNEKALKHYEEYIRIAPNSPEANRVRGWMKDKEVNTTMKLKI